MKPTVISFALEIPKFGGPLTAPEISHWLWRCNQAFKKWEKFYNREMDDETKVEGAGNAILNEGVTQRLYEWWVANARHLVEKDWDTFQGLFQDEALGNEWQFKALREYYTATQGNMSARDFYNKLQTLSAVISHIGGDSLAINPFAEKCHLLFRARPSVLDAVLENQLDQLSILREEPEAILQRLEKYNNVPTRSDVKVETKKATATPKPAPVVLKVETKKASATPKPAPMPKVENKKATATPKPPPGVLKVGPQPQPEPLNLSGVVYLLGRAFKGVGTQKRFDDLEYLPGDASPKVRSITLYCRSTEAGTLLSYEIEHTKGRCKSVSSENERYPATTLYLDGDEHVVSCRYTKQKDDSAERFFPIVRDFMLETSKGRTFSIGMPAATWHTTIIAPSGWSIVGFHGHTTRGIDVEVIESLGCIFGRR